MAVYYTGRNAMQTFDFIEAFDLGFNLGNVAKYIARCGKKGDNLDAINDLKKAIAYLEREILCRNRMEAEKSGLKSLAIRENLGREL